SRMYNGQTARVLQPGGPRLAVGRRIPRRRRLPRHLNYSGETRCPKMRSVPAPGAVEHDAKGHGSGECGRGSRHFTPVPVALEVRISLNSEVER
ncbi:MAG TPA: hypothetical protein VGW37_05130, partial [Terriglobia bacterium]|nr:hypothetical protein [Terriglobia bacterium]